jgi:hypothetical protein
LASAGMERRESMPGGAIVMKNRCLGASVMSLSFSCWLRLWIKEDVPKITFDWRRKMIGKDQGKENNCWAWESNKQPFACVALLGKVRQSLPS